MKKLFYNLKNNKPLLVVVIIVSLIILFDLFLIVYDVLQFIEIRGNIIVRYAGQSTINRIGTVANVFAIFTIIAYIIYRRRKIKVQINDKTKSQ